MIFLPIFYLFFVLWFLQMHLILVVYLVMALIPIYKYAFIHAKNNHEKKAKLCNVHLRKAHNFFAFVYSGINAQYHLFFFSLRK